MRDEIHRSSFIYRYPSMPLTPQSTGCVEITSNDTRVKTWGV